MRRLNPLNRCRSQADARLKSDLRPPRRGGSTTICMPPRSSGVARLLLENTSTLAMKKKYRRNQWRNVWGIGR